MSACSLEGIRTVPALAILAEILAMPETCQSGDITLLHRRTSQAAESDYERKILEKHLERDPHAVLSCCR